MAYVRAFPVRLEQAEYIIRSFAFVSNGSVLVLV